MDVFGTQCSIKCSIFIMYSFLIAFLLVACSENVSMHWNVETEAAPRWHVPLGIFTSAATEL